MISFLDYWETDALTKLTEEDIKNILYLSHMWQPIDSPFFEVLKNRFTYLAHDDDWYCKLYIRNPNEFLDIVAKKIEKYVEQEVNTKGKRKDKKNFRNKDRIIFLKTSGSEIPEINSQIKQRIFEKWREGLYIDLSDMRIAANKIIIKTYIIGNFNDMDEMFNNIEQHKQHAAQRHEICLSKKEWMISK